MRTMTFVALAIMSWSWILLNGSYSRSDPVDQPSFAPAEPVPPPNPTTEHGLSNETDLGISIVSGNSDDQAYNAKEELAYLWSDNSLRAHARYLRDTARGAEIAKQWDAQLRYDRILSEPVSLFAAHTIESNIYSDFVQRDATDIGAKYKLFKDEHLSVSAEAGYRYLSIQYVNPIAGVNPDTSAARLYLETQYALAPNVSARWWVEYIPTFADPSQYYINTEPSVTVLLVSVLALKMSYLISYQNPNVANAGIASYTDTTYLTSLVAKFNLL